MVAMGYVRLTVALAIAGHAASAQAQESGRPERGHAIAQERCASCHAIGRAQVNSPHRGAAPFAAVASAAGMTATALRASLETSHRTMPDLILEPDDMRDVIAYILGLARRE
jgi:mono/diheme cytochrome c family protein